MALWVKMHDPATGLSTDAVGSKAVARRSNSCRGPLSKRFQFEAGTHFGAACFISLAITSTAPAIFEGAKSSKVCEPVLYVREQTHLTCSIRGSSSSQKKRKVKSARHCQLRSPSQQQDPRRRLLAPHRAKREGQVNRSPVNHRCGPSLDGAATAYLLACSNGVRAPTGAAAIVHSAAELEAASDNERVALYGWTAAIKVGKPSGFA